MNKPNASVPLTNVQPVTKTSLAARKPEQAPIGSGHNVSAKPFATVPQVNGTEPIKAIVNKQYNTPVGIYSEETIAETLSAQAEVLAGGVLGVNFKKNERNYDAAKSEVLKMIHEIDKEPREPEPDPEVNASLGSRTAVFPVTGLRHVSAPETKVPSSDQPSSPYAVPKASLPPGQNICADCERLIVGVFVRIKDKNLHVECFKCATCGTSLKNVGYYNINNKLYCDIHAKLVARHHPPAPNLEPVTVPPGVKAPAGAISAALAHSMGSQSGPGTPTPLATQPMSPQPGTMAPLPFHPISQSTELETSETDYPSNVTKHKEPNQSVGLMPTMEFRDTRSKSPENGIGINSRIEMVDQNIARTTSDTVMQNGHRRVNMPTHFANETNPSFLGTNNKDVVTDVIIPNEVQKLTLEDSSSSSHPAMIIHENNNNIAKETNSTIMTNGNGKEFKSPSASAPKPFSSVSAPAPAASVTRPTSDYSVSTLRDSVTKKEYPHCESCGNQIPRGPFITALGKTWCPDHFVCVQEGCRRPLQDIGFVEEQGRLYCEYCFEKFLAPTCNKCSNKIKGDCLNAIGQHFHPECFACAYCRKLFGNNPFFLEDGLPYCEADWNELFTTKCFACGFPIEAGDKWVEALNNNYHSQCFNCSMCKKNLEGQSFYAKSGRPFCKNHAR